MHRRLSGLLPLPLLLFGCAIFLLGLSDFSEDDLHCEQAAVKLQQCCPGFDVEDLTCYTSRGCDGEVNSPPVFSGAESRCIEDRPCDELVAHDLCRRAAVRQRLIDEDSVDAFDEEVCP